MANVKFQDLGFFVEYLVDGKLMGSKIVSSNPKGTVGYHSTERHVATEAIKFKNKTIKKGANYVTRVYPMCGKVITNKN